MTDEPPTLLNLTSYLLSRVGKEARGRLAQRLSARDLRLWHFAVLAALADYGTLPQRELGQQLRIDPSDVAKVLDELNEKRWIKRARDATDRRRINVEITAAGNRALDAMLDDAATVQSKLLAGLADDQKTQLHDLLLCVFADLTSKVQPPRHSG